MWKSVDSSLPTVSSDSFEAEFDGHVVNVRELVEEMVALKMCMDPRKEKGIEELYAKYLRKVLVKSVQDSRKSISIYCLDGCR